MLKKLNIRTNREDTDCAVCGRTLLRGEQAELFVAGGSSRHVCELCTLRAQHEGWVRAEAVLEEKLGSRQARGRDSRRNSLMDRWRAGRRRDGEPDLEGSPQDEQSANFSTPLPSERTQAVANPGRSNPTPEAYRDRQVRAVPASPELKMQRALELFNSSEHTKTVAGVARSLGSPQVSVRLRTDEPSVVVMTVMWELSWYRFEVDLADQATEVRCDGQGAELSELGEGSPFEANATATDQGQLALVGVSSIP